MGGCFRIYRLSSQVYDIEEATRQSIMDGSHLEDVTQTSSHVCSDKELQFLTTDLMLGRRHKIGIRSDLRELISFPWNC